MRFGQTSQWRSRRMVTLLLLILYLCAGFVILFSAIYRQAEEECIGRLRESTAEFSRSLHDRVQNDLENMGLLADIIAIAQEEDPAQIPALLGSFEKHSLVDRVEILYPDDTLLTPEASFYVGGKISFAEEAAKGIYITDRSPGLVYEDSLTVRLSIPMERNGSLYAILMGTIDLEKMPEVYPTTIYDGQAELYVLEADTNNFLMDTLHESVSDTATLGTREYKDGFDRASFAADVAAGRDGYAVFRSQATGEYLYMYYTDVGINEWRAMMSVPESVALSYAFDAREALALMAAYSVLGLAVYFTYTLTAEKRTNRKNDHIISIQTMLLEAHRSSEHFYRALEVLSSEGRGRMAFLIDSDDEETGFLTAGESPLCAAFHTSERELKEELLLLARRYHRGMLLYPSAVLSRECPRIAAFLERNDLRNLAFAPVTTRGGPVDDIIGVLETWEGRRKVQVLEAVSFSFSMALHSIRYLRKIEVSSTMDALTGAMNRASYHERLGELAENVPERLGCIYIDVNELHIINNRFGHDMGDAMLRTIAEVLKSTFDTKNVYRIGGDEFVILLTETDREGMEALIRRSRGLIEAHRYHVSIGWKFCGEQPNVQAMIRTAEDRMYEDKLHYYETHGQSDGGHLSRRFQVRA